MTAHLPRLPFGLDPLMAETKRRMRRRRVLILILVVVIGGGAASAAMILNSSNPTTAVGSECGSGVVGRGFRFFDCMSGGARAGHPHPKELLVVRNDGSSVAYPDYGGQDFAVGDGEVVALYDDNLVRVTSGRLVPLLTYDELSRALHARVIWPIYDLRVEARGDVHFVVSFMRRSHGGCQNRVLERTAAGKLRQIRALPTKICS
jgi:hypothetical protein